MSDELGYIRVVNVKGEEDFRPTKDETLIMMDRTNKVLGNQHFMRVHSRLERERVIEAHRKDLEADFAVDGPKRQALWKIAMDIVQNGTRVAAGCHCAPKPCHLDLLAATITGMVQEIRNEANLDVQIQNLESAKTETFSKSISKP